MFRRFARVCSQLPGIENRVVDKDYGEEKGAAVDYQVITYKKSFLQKIHIIFQERQTWTYRSFSTRGVG